MDWNKLHKFLSYTSKITKKTQINLFLSSIKDSLIYNISILDYFQFRFFEKNKINKRTYAGTGFMYEYQLKMNPKEKRVILNDKCKFYRNYQKFFLHKVYSLNELKEDKSSLTEILNNNAKNIVLKLSNGKCGAQVEIRNTKEFDPNNLLEYMSNNNYDMVEEFVQQHSLMNGLSPSGVNTVRIITQLNNKDEVEILGCRLRISVNSGVDNLAAGNLAAPIDEKTGIVNGNAVYSDITKPDQEYHPITNVRIKGFQIPFWEETVKLAKEAALLHKENRSIGWDIVITDKGPGLIEGNHDWCKLLWQLPVNKGLKSVLENYFS